MSLALDKGEGGFFNWVRKTAGALGEHGAGLLGLLGHHQVQTYSYVLAFVGMSTFIAVSSNSLYYNYVVYLIYLRNI